MLFRSNLSCLTQISAGSSLAVGFVVGGSTAKTVLVRVSGPALNVIFGIGGVMAAPQVQLSALSNSGAILASNTGWAGNSTITTVAGSVGAFSWPNANSGDSAVLVSLAPGPYTVQVSSANGASGTVLVEIYDVQ